MGYILILLVFLIYRNTVNIRKAVNYAAYGCEYKTGIIKKMFVTLANIRKEEKEEKQVASRLIPTRKNHCKSSGFLFILSPATSDIRFLWQYLATLSRTAPHYGIFFTCALSCQIKVKR